MMRRFVGVLLAGAFLGVCGASVGVVAGSGVEGDLVGTSPSLSPTLGAVSSGPKSRMHKMIGSSAPSMPSTSPLTVTSTPVGLNQYDQCVAACGDLPVAYGKQIAEDNDCWGKYGQTDKGVACDNWARHVGDYMVPECEDCCGRVYHFFHTEQCEKPFPPSPRWPGHTSVSLAAVASTPVGSTQDCLDSCDRTEDKCIAGIPKSCSYLVECNTRMQRQCFAKTKDCRNQCYWSVSTEAESQVAIQPLADPNQCAVQYQQEMQACNDQLAKCGQSMACIIAAQQCQSQALTDMQKCGMPPMPPQQPQQPQPPVVSSVASALLLDECERRCLDDGEEWRQKVLYANGCEENGYGSCQLWASRMTRPVVTECQNCCGTIYHLMHDCSGMPTTIPQWPGK